MQALDWPLYIPVAIVRKTLASLKVKVASEPRSYMNHNLSTFQIMWFTEEKSDHGRGASARPAKKVFSLLDSFFTTPRSLLNRRQILQLQFPQSVTFWKEKALQFLFKLNL